MARAPAVEQRQRAVMDERGGRRRVLVSARATERDPLHTAARDAQTRRFGLPRLCAGGTDERRRTGSTGEPRGGFRHQFGNLCVERTGVRLCHRRYATLLCPACGGAALRPLWVAIAALPARGINASGSPWRSPPRWRSARSRFNRPPPAAIPAPATWPDDRITIANLGHATLLMNFLGSRIITDPTLFDRIGLAVGPLFTIGPQRLVAPPLRPDQLQALDVILITHAHMDHLDLPSLRA